MHRIFTEVFAAMGAIACLASASIASHAAEPAQTPLCVPTPEPLQQELVRMPVSVDDQPEGLIRLQLEIAPDGTVRNPVVLESTNHALDDYALKSVRQWRYPTRDVQCRTQTLVRYRSDE